MEEILDKTWEHISIGFLFFGDFLFSLLKQLHFLGPLLIISLLALCTVAITKLFNRVIITKRYLELEKTFHHWVQLREEALKCHDSEKGKRLARNIDQAELNKAYYDYFFEGLLLGIARKVIPIFFVFAFINEYYRPDRMIEYFGSQYIVQISSLSEKPVLVGTVFWYILSLISLYLLWPIAKKVFRSIQRERSLLATPLADTSHNRG